VLNKKPPQGWTQALKKRRQMNLGMKRRMSPHRLRLQERQPTTSRTEPAQAQAAEEERKRREELQLLRDAVRGHAGESRERQW
jgi:hypothetical protein